MIWTNLKMNKTLINMFWSFFDLFSRQGIALIVQMILARLLLPEEFGLIGMIMVFIMISHSLVNSGFDQSLIRQEKVENIEYSTIFTFNIFISIIIYTVLFICAPYISKFYNNVDLINIIRILMLVVVINAMTIIQRVILFRRIDFKIQSQITLIAIISSGVFAIFLAYNNFGVWALVYQQIVMQILISIGLIYFVRWVPSLKFSKKHFLFHFKFSYKLVLSGIIDTFNRNIFNIILGKAIGATYLGYYTNARKISDISSGTLSSAIQRVTFREFSLIKNDKNKLVSAQNKIITITNLIYIPVAFLVYYLSPLLIPIFFGDNWNPTIEILQILILSSIFIMLFSMHTNIFKVIGRSDLFLLVNILSILLTLIYMIIFIFIKFTLLNIGIMILIQSITIYLITSYLASSQIGKSYMSEWKQTFSYLFVYSIPLSLCYILFNKLLINRFIGAILLTTAFVIMIYLIITKVFKIKILSILK